MRRIFRAGETAASARATSLRRHPVERKRKAGSAANSAKRRSMAGAKRRTRQAARAERGRGDFSLCLPPEGSISSLGEVAEWSIAEVLKTSEAARSPWVRIPPSPPIHRLRVRRNGDNGQDRDALFPGAFIRSIMEKHPISTRRIVLGIRFPNALAIGSCKRCVFVRLQAGMARIEFEQSEGLQDLLI